MPVAMTVGTDLTVITIAQHTVMGVSVSMSVGVSVPMRVNVTCDSC